MDWKLSSNSALQHRTECVKIPSAIRKRCSVSSFFSALTRKFEVKIQRLSLYTMKKPNFNRSTILNGKSQVIEVTAAMELRKSVAGDYSCDYSDLVPKWLPQIPIDPFTGKPRDFNSHNGEGKENINKIKREKN